MTLGNRDLPTQPVGSMSDREKDLREWCADQNLDPDDRLAPHVLAFLAGHSYGFERGYDGGWKTAVAE